MAVAQAHPTRPLTLKQELFVLNMRKISTRLGRRFERAIEAARSREEKDGVGPCIVHCKGELPATTGLEGSQPAADELSACPLDGPVCEL